MTDQPMTRLVIDAEMGAEPARLEFEAKTFRAPRFANQAPGVRLTIWSENGRQTALISASEFERLVKHAAELHRTTVESWNAAAISPPPHKD